MIEFIIPAKTVNELNGSHQHWRTVSKRRKIIRKMSFAMTSSRQPLARVQRWRAGSDKAVITMTRQSAGTLDDDGLRAALKSVRDGIADAYGLADNDPRFDWRYDQEKAKRGASGVRVRIEERDGA